MVVSSAVSDSLVLVVPRPRRICPCRLTRRKLNKRRSVEGVNAAHAIVDQTDHKALQVTMDTTVSTDSKASPEIVARQLQLDPFKKPLPKPNAPAKLHRETLAQPDPKDPTEHQAMPAQQALTDNQEAQDPQDHPAQLDPLVKTELQDPKETMERPTDLIQAHQVQPDLMANQALQVLLVNQAVQAKMEDPVVQALQEMLVLQAVQAKPAAQAVLAMQVSQVLQAVANTAHRLVWLQVIKQHRHQAHIGDKTDHGKKSIFSKSFDIFPKMHTL